MDNIKERYPRYYTECQTTVEYTYGCEVSETWLKDGSVFTLREMARMQLLNAIEEEKKEDRKESVLLARCRKRTMGITEEAVCRAVYGERKCIEDSMKTEGIMKPCTQTRRVL